MIPGITEINFPRYATLHEATISFSEMGDRIITARVKIDGDEVPDFSTAEWTLMYEGERFVLNTHTPQASKDNTTRNSIIDATFQSFPVAELKRYFFVELSEVETGTMIVDKYIASLRVNAYNFIEAFKRVLKYYYGNLFEMEVAQGTTLDPEVKDVELNYTYVWEAVGKLYDVYGLVWKLSERNGKYIITVGNTVENVSDHIFQYGFEGGLTRIERQLQDAEIYNQLLGRGGTKNLPYRYFKKTDPYNEIWAADPDACAELENVYFERLMDINFRYYVKGWLRNPHRPANPDYPVPSTPEPTEIQNHWAYQKGLTDAKFQPVEYVEDAASVAEYGVRQGKLEDDDDIFPTIQGITVSPYGRIDEIVAIGAITDGDDSGIVEETSLGNITKAVTTDTGLPLATFDFYGPQFSVPADRRGEVRYTLYMSDDTTGAVEPNFAYAATINTDYTKVVAERLSDGEHFPVSAIPGGDDYRIKVTFVINKFPTEQQTSRVVGIQDVRLFTSLHNADANDNPYCFRVWVKNIWQTSKGANESALEYMKRVWEPILGDRMGNEAKIVFSDGWMSASSDYEFTIVDWPVFDQSKSINGVQSEWMLTLAKSDAEVETTGKYIPNATSAKPVAGDHFFFTGIDMPHIYVVWAEKKLNEKKQEALDKEAYANPTWAVQLDPVRINTLVGNESVTLMSQLAVGKVMKIYDPRFSGGQVLGLAIRSMTITWHEGAVMLPSVDIVLSENVLSRTSYGGVISPSSIEAQIDGAISRMGAAAQRSFLSKEHDDVAVGKLQMAAGATFGAIGQYEEGAQTTPTETPAATIDESGHAEFDSMRLRKWLEVPELRYNRTEVQVGNQWRAPGGGIIESVTPDVDAHGNVLNTGTVNLKLEEGEIGKVAVDDICMGIFHDSINENSNAVADLDDSKGNFHFSGFYTTYFRITQVLGANNQCFRYSLRPVSASWTETFHPCAQMHFVCYGNFDGVNHADRQSSRYSTRTYERYLKNVNTWEFQPSNVAAQFGELSNLVELGLPGMTGYSTYIDNLYMTGHIQQVGLPLHIDVDWNGQNVLGTGDSVDMAFNLMQGFDNLNELVTSWSIARDTGDAAADAAWNAAYSGWNDNVATLATTDLAATGLSTLFTVTAVVNDAAHSVVEYGFTLMKVDASIAHNVVLLDLNNENDTMLYDKEGHLLSGNVVSTATLYDGNTPVSDTLTYTISNRSGVSAQQASISGNVLTVTGMQTVSSGYVDVSTTYNGVTYTARLTLKRLVGDVKYDLLVSPDSIAYNATTATISTSQINIKVFRTAQNNSGSVTREEADELPSGWALKVDGTTVTYPGVGGYTITGINAAALASRSSYAITLVNSDNDIADAETVPVNKVADGAPGQDAESPVYADLSNEMQGVAVDTDGNTTAQVEMTTTASMYYGVTPLTLLSITVANLPSSYTVQKSVSTGVITITIPSGTAVDANRAATITLEGRLGSSGPTYTRDVTFTVAGVRAGGSGANAVVYSLLPSVTSVKKTKDGNYSVATVTCAKMKSEGNEAPSTTSDGVLSISLDGGNEESYPSGGVPTSGTGSFTNTLTFFYKINGVLVDKETVPLIIDGEDGEPGAPGAAGGDAIHLDLNNENDSMLYDAELNKLSGNVVSTATLYEGGEAVTSGVTYSHTASTGLTVSRSGNTVTVSAMTVVSGQVVVSATYNGKTYTAQLNLTRLVGASKYELICTPDSIAYNSTTGAISSSTINVKIYKTAQVSNGAVGRTLLTSLPSGVLWLGVDGSGVTYSGSNGYTFNVDTTKSSHVVTLRAGSSSANIWDQETIPINKVANGAKGADGQNGSDGAPGAGVIGQEIRYQVGTSATTVPTGVWETSVPTSYGQGDYLWTRTRLQYTGGSYGDPSYSVSYYGEDGDPGAPGSPGSPGAQGIAGCTVRVSTWEVGKVYHNDENITDASTTRYIDVVVMENVHVGATSSVQAYKCKVRSGSTGNYHTSSASNKPGSGSSWTTYWEAMSTTTPMMTPLLIAETIKAGSIDVGSITATNTFINAVKAQRVEADRILTTANGSGYLQMQDNYLRMFDASNQERLLVTGGALSTLSAQSTSDPGSAQSWSNATVGAAISYNANVDEKTVTYTKTIVSGRSLSQARILSLPKVSVTINVTRTSAVQGTQYFIPIVSWLVDGNEVATYYGNNETLNSTSKSTTAYLPAASMAVASGSHTVVAQVSIYFTNLAQMQSGSITAKSSGSVSTGTILWSTSVKKTEIANDGFRAALSADAYIMAQLSGSSPIIELINGSYGLRVTSSAVQIKRNGTWSDL